MESIDRLRQAADELAQRAMPCSNAPDYADVRWKVNQLADEIEREVEDELKAKDGQTWLRGYGECHAELLEGNEVIAASLEEAGWVKLPVSEDGDVLHIGELVDEKLPFGGYAAPAPIDTMELSRGASGDVWMVRLDAENSALISPKLLRHHRAPTVEDVLREFADEVWNRYCNGTTASDSGIRELEAEFAAKLRLAGDE
ncbi:MAG: hypothetical protein IJM67_05740 [Atopobiaceae bacterium]|nr:hypothetical protein [Atopobiaceae bacterium]